MIVTNHKTGVEIAVLFVLLLVIAGCQSTPEASVAAEGPKLDVIEEGEVECQLKIIGEYENIGILRTEPELEEVLRGHVIWGDMDCTKPFMTGRVIALQDMGDNIWTSFDEFITDEGGVWKGFCENDETSSKCSWEGEAKYQGLHLETDLIWDTSSGIYRLAKVVEE